MKNKFIILFIFSTSIIKSEINFSINGDYSFFCAIKTSDSKVLDIPFRLSNIHSTIYINNFEIYHTYAFEYHKVSFSH